MEQRPEWERARGEARQYLAGVLDDINDPERFPRDGSYTYDTRTGTARGFMLAGGGPTVWAWFVSTELGQIDVAALEHSTDDGRSVYVEIPDHVARQLFDALTLDARAREARR